MKKKIVSFGLLFVTILTLFTGCGKEEVEKYGLFNESGELVIGYNAFAEKYGFNLGTDYIHPDEWNAFLEDSEQYGTNLTLKIPETATFVRQLNNWNGISYIEIPNSVTEIGGFAFSQSSLKRIEIPDGVTKIESDTFWKCYELEEVIIPNSVTEFGVNVFASCENLTSIKLPENITEISKSPLGHCKNLKNVTIPVNVTKIGDWALGGTAIEDITVPDGVTEIGEYAFSNCKNLKTLILPASLENIGECSFWTSDDDRNVELTIYFKGTEEQWNNLIAGIELVHDDSTKVICNYSENK